MCASWRPFATHLCKGLVASNPPWNSLLLDPVTCTLPHTNTWLHITLPRRAISHMSLHNSSGQAGRSKVAIPKLVQKRPDAPRKAAVSRLNRVNRACLSCRSRKIKCNGARPSCFNCQDNGTTCVYASSRKDRLKTLVSGVLQGVPC
jgi:hypothetical protein